jgi:hypothetical protein
LEIVVGGMVGEGWRIAKNLQPAKNKNLQPSNLLQPFLQPDKSLIINNIYI